MNSKLIVCSVLVDKTCLHKSGYFWIGLRGIVNFLDHYRSNVWIALEIFDVLFKDGLFLIVSLLLNNFFVAGFWSSWGVFFERINVRRFFAFFEFR